MCIVVLVASAVTACGPLGDAETQQGLDNGGLTAGQQESAQCLAKRWVMREHIHLAAAAALRYDNDPWHHAPRVKGCPAGPLVRPVRRRFPR
jgi:hypothetical protein